MKNRPKCLYFIAPKFRKWKLEQRIINELHAPCYRIVNKNFKQFSNDNMLINWDGNIITVYTSMDFVESVNTVFYMR